MGKLTSLKIFCCAAETLCFSRTADLLHISPAMVSKRIAQLEVELDTTLFSRTTRQIKLTEEGLAYHLQCKLIIDDLEELESAIRGKSQADTGKLRLSLPMDFGIKVLAPVIAEYLSQHPRVSLDTVYDDQFVDLVAGHFDLAIRIGAHFPDSSLVAKRLAPACAVLCASPDYLSKHQPIQELQDLRQHNCILYSNARDQLYWRLDGPNGEERIRIDGSLRSNNGNSIVLSALKGLGVALLPLFLIDGHLTQGELVQVLPEFSVSDLGIYAIYLKQLHVPAKVKTFVEFLGQKIPLNKHYRMHQSNYSGT